MSMRAIPGRRFRPFRRAQAGYIGIGNRRGLGGGQTWEQYIQSLKDRSEFFAPLTHSAIPTRAAAGTTATFTRANTKTWPNNDGYQVTGVAGEIGFVGARRVRNLVVASENLVAWSGTGTVTATTLTMTGASQARYSPCTVTGTLGRTFVASATLSVASGTATIAMLTTNALAYNTGNGTTITVTTTPTRYSLVSTMTGANNTTINLILGDVNYTNGASISATLSKAITIEDIQLEDVTAETDKTTAREYVSVGVPSDWKGTELVTNGTFDTATTGWTAGEVLGGAAGTLSVVGGRMRITNTGTSYGAASQSFTTVVGAKYILTSDFVLGSASSGHIRIGSTGFASFDLGLLSLSANGRFSAEFTATTTTTTLTVYNLNNAGAYNDFDNISVKVAYYHGSMVDGVKCFATDISGNPLPTAYTYDAVSLNGVAGTYVSTPDSVANSITGDIDIRVKAMLTDWTPSAVQGLIGKDPATGANRSYQFSVDTTGKLQARFSTEAAVQLSSVATGFADGSTNWVRLTRTSADGAVKFYTSADGSSWTQLGADVAGTAGALADSSQAVAVGSWSGGASFNTSGKIYQAQIYNGINGTLAVDFNASRYAGGTTLTGSTGETWTLQGNAVIYPTNQPLLGYSAEGARTNLCLQSGDQTNALYAMTGVTLAKNVVGSDGTTSMTTLTELAPVTPHYVYFSNSGAVGIAVSAGATATFSVDLKAGTRRYVVVAITSAANGVGIVVDTQTWTIQSTYNSGTGAGAVGYINPTQYANGVRRVSITGALATVAAYYPLVGGSGVGGTHQSSYAGDGSTVITGAWQLEVASFASSYIATTTIAVARNADVLTYSSAGNIDGTKGWAYAEVTSAVIPTGDAAIIGSGANSVPMLFRGFNLAAYDGTAYRTYQTGSPNATGVPRKYSNTWGGVTTSGYINGAAGANNPVTFDGDLGVSAVIEIGSYNSLNQPYNIIRNVRIGQRTLSVSEGGAITT